MSAVNSMCLRKNGYPSRIKALICAVRRTERGAPALRVYKCPHCYRWHLTKQVEKNASPP